MVSVVEPESKEIIKVNNVSNKFYLYILRSSNNELYIGQTNNLQSREYQQTTKTSKAAKFIKDNINSFKLVYYEEYETRIEAMRREKQLKGWTRLKKEALIMNNFELLKRL